MLSEKEIAVIQLLTHQLENQSPNVPRKRKHKNKCDCCMESSMDGNLPSKD